MNVLAAAVAVAVALASRGSASDQPMWRVDVGRKMPPPATTPATTTTTATPATTATTTPATTTAACKVASTDKRNWITNAIGLPGGAYVCATRAFLPGVENDPGHDVITAYDAKGGVAWQFALDGRAQHVVVDGARIAIVGAGGVLVIDTKGAGVGFVPVEGYVDQVALVDGVVVADFSGTIVGVDVRAAQPKRLWTTPDGDRNDDRNDDRNYGRGLWPVCGGVVVAPQVSRTLTYPPDHDFRQGGMPVTHGDVVVRLIDPKKGVVASVKAGSTDAFFDEARVDVTCDGSPQLQVRALFIVLD